jgi:glycosyltransferase involved in cell wall biosynthesis
MLGVGNYIHKKNWITVINAIKKFDNLLFLLVGDGEEREKYKMNN